jgi:hypothetical protein
MTEEEAAKTKERLHLIREFIQEYEADPTRFNSVDLAVVFECVKKVLEELHKPKGT